MSANDELKDYEERLKEWKKKFTDDWDYRRKLVVFQDGDGNLYTPTTTTTTTTTTPSTTPIQNTSFSKVTIIDIVTTPKTGGAATTESTSDLLKLVLITVGVLLCVLLIAGFFIWLCQRSTPKTGGAATTESTSDLLKLVLITVGVLLCVLLIAGFFIWLCRRSTPKTGGAAETESTSDLLKLVLITVGVLLCVLLIAGFFIWLCRRSSKKKKRNLSVRRPLEGPEPEDHIYAEIEPLQQYGRTSDPDGASGNTSDIPLPARKRRRGISSFSGLSTRIQKFFSIKKRDDNQSVFYKRNGESAIQTVSEAPEPPVRNLNGRRDKNKKVHRGESTASRRPLLDGDSQISQLSQPSTSSVELPNRNSTYNALIKDETSRNSGPYDTLNRQRQSENEYKTSGEVEPESPHDYFKLEKSEIPDIDAIDEDTPVYTGGSEILAINHDVGNMETIQESEGESDAEAEPAQPHDYFVLEPHEREKSQKGKSNKQSPEKASDSVDKLNDSETVQGKVPSSSDKTKPTPKPRGTIKGSPEKKSPSHEGDSTESGSPSKNKKMNEYVAYSAMSGRSSSKEDDYEISKLGEAPRPPDKVDADGQEEEEENDYLKPLEEKAREYVDVFPNPPPRSTSLLHDDLDTKNKDSSSSYVSSPAKSSELPSRRKTSPTKSTSKSPKPPPRPKSAPPKSPPKSLRSPRKPESSPAKSINSPVKSNSSPIKVVGSPAKSAGSPVKLAGVPTKSTETEV